MGWSQIIVIALYIVALLLLSANKHGKPREGSHNFWYDSLGVVVMSLLIYILASVLVKCG